MIYTWEYEKPDFETDERWENEAFRTIFTVMLRSSTDLIVNSNVNGCGDIATVSPNVFLALKTIDKFEINENPELDYDASILRYKVYIDKNLEEDCVIVSNSNPESDESIKIEIKGLEKTYLANA